MKYNLEKSEVINLYRNSNSKFITSEETGITYEYIAKIKNPFDEPIVVPYVQYHQLPIEQGFDCKVSGDSLIDIEQYGTSDYLYFGADTLHPGETQRNFALITSYDTEYRESPFNIIDFRYYYLEDYVNNQASYEAARHVFFILFKDSTQNVHIYKTITGFNPYYHNSHPIPPHAKNMLIVN